MDQQQKAATFMSLHIAGDPVLLYNVWDAVSTAAVAGAGASAVATSSWSVAAAQGYPDGQDLPVNVMIFDGLPATPRLADIGGARISWGNASHVDAMAAVARAAEPRPRSRRSVRAKCGGWPSRRRCGPSGAVHDPTRDRGSGPARCG